MLEHEDITRAVIGAAMEVHRVLGPGLLENVYEQCLCRELELREIKFKSQVEEPVLFKGLHLDAGFRIDILVENLIVVELKAVERILSKHIAQ